MVYRFRDLELHTEMFRLRRGNATVTLEPRVLDLILYLIHQRHRMVSKTELIERVWRLQVVGSSVVARAICLARRALGSPKAIRTVHTRGYQWAEPVEVIETVAPEVAAVSAIHASPSA